MIRSSCITRSLRRFSASANGFVPDKIMLDIIDSVSDDKPCTVKEAEDFGALLRTHRKCVVFAVPGAFTPTCSAQHLPGFIERAREIRAKGVEEIYCLSVNDRFVMRAWAESTAGCRDSGIKLVADGNGDYTAALGKSFDLTKARLGHRSKRYAAIIENGKITSLNIDEGKLQHSSAEAILKLL